MNVFKNIIAIFNPAGPYLERQALQRELNSAAITAQIRAQKGRAHAL